MFTLPSRLYFIQVQLCIYAKRIAEARTGNELLFLTRRLVDFENELLSMQN